MDTSLTITTALDALHRQKTTAQNLAEACFRQIERLNPTLNAFITVIHPDDALKVQYPAGTGPLTKALRGIPIALKDLFDTADICTTAGSKFFADNVPDTDAYVVNNLKQAARSSWGKQIRMRSLLV